MKILKRAFFIFALALLLLLGYLMLNMFSVDSFQGPAEKSSVEMEQLQEADYEKLAKALRFPTISLTGHVPDSTALTDFHEHLEASFPKVYENLDLTIINNFSLLFHWKGSNPNLNPIVLLAHQDVVPVEKSDLDDWKHAPWAGEMDDQMIYGRGAIDDKGGLLAQLQSVELLLNEGFQPERSIYLAFGHDEEIGGESGAQQIAQYLHKQEVKAEFVLDEGMYILKDMVPGLVEKVAFIGIAEKGYASVKLSIEIDGGHSSIPKKENAISVLAGALDKISEQALKPRLTEPVLAFIHYLGPEMPFVQRLAFANHQIFNKLILNIYTKSGPGNALVRTSSVPTIFRAGSKDNVVPNRAEAIINFRLLPGDSDETILDYLRQTISDERVQFEVIQYDKASQVSPIDSDGFLHIKRSITQIFPDVLISPNLMVGGSDSKHYELISQHIYRFRPFEISPENINFIHGMNESLPKAEYEKAVHFYKQLISNACQGNN